LRQISAEMKDKTEKYELLSIENAELSQDLKNKCAHELKIENICVELNKKIDSLATKLSSISN